jgi:hypothetical protein
MRLFLALRVTTLIGGHEFFQANQEPGRANEGSIDKSPTNRQQPILGEARESVQRKSRRSSGRSNLLLGNRALRATKEFRVREKSLSYRKSEKNYRARTAATRKLSQAIDLTPYPHQADAQSPHKQHHRKSPNLAILEWLRAMEHLGVEVTLNNKSSVDKDCRPPKYALANRCVPRVKWHVP